MDFFNSLESKIKGTLGEGIAGAVLYHLCIKGYKGTPFHNIYLPKDNGEYSEVDLAYVTTKGILIFECKNYAGWIFGSAQDRYWTVSFPNGQKNSFYNPVLQNQSHLRAMRRVFGNEIPYFSIVVFSDRCTFKKVNVDPTYANVVQLSGLSRLIENAWPQMPDVLSEETVNSICEKMKTYTHKSSEVKKTHIENIKAKKTDYENKNRQEPEKSAATVANDIMDIISSTFRK